MVRKNRSILPRLILSEGLGESIEDLDLAIEEALGELARFSLIRLTPETVSVHRLLQAVEQDALTKEECARWLEWAVRLFNGFASGSPDDARRWSIWPALRPHAEALIKHTQSDGMNARLKLCCHWIGLAGVFSMVQDTTFIGSVCIGSTISSIWNSKSLRIDAPLARCAVVRTRGVACNARTPKPAYRAIVSGRDGLRAVPFFSLLPGPGMIRRTARQPSLE
jgi:hypothetical protein